MEKIDHIKDIMKGMERDVEKLETKGNKSAAVRIRQGLMDVIKLSKFARKEVQDLKNELNNTDPPF